MPKVVVESCVSGAAPLTPDAGDYLMRMLARVEGMPLESLQQGVPWNWESFGDSNDIGAEAYRQKAREQAEISPHKVSAFPTF